MKPLKLTNIFPKSVSIEITTLCPLNCSYCDRKEGGRSMSYEEFIKLKDKLNRIPDLQRITFCGIGEALLHKQFYNMIHDLSKYKITIITSGTLLLDFEELSKDNNVDLVIFSIDATTEEGMKNICGQTYNFNNLMSNINNLKEFNKKSLKRRQYISSVLNCTVNKQNIPDIPQIIEFAAKHKFSCVHYSLPWNKYDFVEENLSILKEKFREAMAISKKTGVYVEDPFHSYCCITYDHIMPYININGDYFYCGSTLNKNDIAGNIFAEDVVDIWNNDACNTFKCGDICNDCYLIKLDKFHERR